MDIQVTTRTLHNAPLKSLHDVTKWIHEISRSG